MSEAAAIPAPAAEELRQRASSRWMDAASDWFNPILVKEVRQSLKSRQFVVTFMLLLTGAWLVSFLSIMWMGNAIEYGNVAPDIFYWYYVVLSGAMFIIVPFSAFRSLLAERDDNTFDLLSITTLAPRQIVRGKLLSSLVQLFIYYSAVAPFIAFTSMLKGFSWPEVLYVLTLSLLVSMLACMGCLMASTLVKSRTWQGFTSLAVLGGLFAVFAMFAVEFEGRRRATSIAGAIINTTLPREAWFWWANVLGLSIASSYFVLFQQITTSRLTFESGNRSSGIRLVAFGQIWLVWLGTFAYLMFLAARYPERPWTDFSRVFRELGPMLASLTIVHVAFAGLFASTESEQLSRRLLRGIPSRSLGKLAVVPWLPGCGRGYLYTLLCLASLMALVLGGVMLADGISPAAALGTLFGSGHGYGRNLVQFTACGCCYVAIYCGVGCLAARTFVGTGQVRPAHVRVVVLLVALFAIIIPYMLRSFGVRAFQRYSLLMLPVPFDTLEHVRRGGEFAGAATLLLLTGAGLVIAMNVPALAAGIGEVLTTDPRRLRRIDAARHSVVPSETEDDDESGSAVGNA